MHVSPTTWRIAMCSIGFSAGGQEAPFWANRRARASTLRDLTSRTHER